MMHNNSAFYIRLLSFYLLSQIYVTKLPRSYHYRLIKGDAGFHDILSSPVFRTCNLMKECSYVIMRNRKGDYEMIGGNEANNDFTDAQVVWRKLEPEKELVSRYAKTYQSTDAFNSYKAVDGLKYTNYELDSCTHTNRYSAEIKWWAVEFEKPVVVYDVMITNRGDCCGERLGDFNIRVGYSKEHGKNPICRENIGIKTTGIEVTFECLHEIEGKFLFIESNIAESLTLCEVEVFGIYLYQ